MSNQQLQRFRNALALTLLSLSSTAQYLLPVEGAKGWAKNSINTVVFRKNSLTTIDNLQFIAFYDSTTHLVLGRRQQNSGTWQLKQTQYLGDTRDAHRSISIIVDGEGYLHCCFDEHDSRLRYARTIAPGSLDLGPETPMITTNETRVTYPEFYRLRNGNLLFLYRDGASGNGNLILNQYDKKTKTWTRLQDKLIDGEGKRNAYWQATLDDQGTFHLSWTWRESPDVASNHDIAYARSRDGGKTWETSTGKQYTLPITAATAEYATRIPQHSGLINQTSMCADYYGNPYIASYWRPNGSNIPQYHIVYKDSIGWHIKQASDRKTPFLLGGAGTKRIPMSRPQICERSGYLYLLYRDAEQGNKITLAVSNSANSPFTIANLGKGANADYGNWEPTYDQQLWATKHILDIFVQRVGQGDGETLEDLPAQPISILEWSATAPEVRRPTYHIQLSAPEKKAVDYIDHHMADATQLLITSVNINSGTLNTSGVRKVGDLYATELRKLGFTIEWVAEPDSLHRAGHLVATHVGKKGKKLFLIGHLDTVFEPDMPAGPYTVLDDSTATGQGVNDMKGGDVVMITALQALDAAGQLKDMNIIAYFTGDEERSGSPHSVARKDFIDRAKTCDIALGFESAMGLHTVAAARRGASGWVLDVNAKTGHSATVFSDSAGNGAIYEAARILNTFREQLSTEKYLTFNPGLIVGGSTINIDPADARGEATGKTNIISPAVHVTGDLRFLTQVQLAAAREKMRAIVANSLPGTHATIRFSDGLAAMEPKPGNLRLVAQLNKTSLDLGLGETLAGDPGARGAGDISDIATYLDCLDGLGASGKGAHRAGETINLREYPLLIKRAAIFLLRLTAY
jgi:glutamate carboxypeptidase